jgi:hypothetical protein
MRWSLVLTSCLIAGTVAHAQGRFVGAEPFQVWVGPNALTAANEEVLARHETLTSDDGMTRESFALLSLVGPIVSWRSEMDGGDELSHFHNESVESIDMRTGTPIGLDAVIEPHAAFVVVLPERDLRDETGDAPDVEAASNTSALDRALSAHQIERTGFAIVSYYGARHLARIRIFVRAPRLHLEYQPYSLDVLVRPARWLVPYLRRTGYAEGHLLERGEIVPE